jgi:tetratricopeptide (TPR) repeat protein
MTPNLDRAFLLYQQTRYAQAELELRQALMHVPDDATAHALLGLCLAQQKRYDEASQEAAAAVHRAPDLPFAHYAMASVLHDRNRLDEAAAAIGEAIRLEPAHAEFFALSAGIHLDRRDWPAALADAEQGLAIDPEHVGCTNLRAIALVKLGRKREAGLSIDAALARDPENAASHANQGWTRLEQGRPAEALHHFRESLRLNPELEWARQGIIEALKARYLIYRWMLRYFLWMAKLSHRAQWQTLLIAYLAYRLLSAVARRSPSLAPWIWPVLALYLAFVLLTWLADPLFNLILRLDRFGRLALSREQTAASNWIGGCLLAALSCAAAWLWTRSPSALLGTLIFGVLMLPIAGTYQCQAGRPRSLMAGYTIGLAALGCAGLLVALLWPPGGRPDSAAVVAPLAGVCLLGSVASGWIVNLLVTVRPRR